MKVQHKTTIDVDPREEWNGGFRYTAYGAHVTIETNDDGLLDALLEAILQVEERTR